MATKPPKKDKLSRYFAELDDSDVSDIEEETKEQSTEPKPEDYITKSKDKPSSENEVLPAPEKVFEDTKKPEFLKRKHDINWDEAATNNTTEKVDLTNTHAVPPPKSHDLLNDMTKLMKPTKAQAQGDDTSKPQDSGGKQSDSNSLEMGWASVNSI